MNSNAAKYLKPQSIIALEKINQFEAKIKYKNANSYCFTHDTSSECSFTRVLYATSNKIFYFIQNRLEYSVYFIDICRIGTVTNKSINLYVMSPLLLRQLNLRREFEYICQLFGFATIKKNIREYVYLTSKLLDLSDCF